MKAKTIYRARPPYPPKVRATHFGAGKVRARHTQNRENVADFCGSRVNRH